MHPGARVAITGASSGIGAAAAVAFAREGARLALAARRTEALEQVAEQARAGGAPDVRTRRVDVRDRAALGAWAADLQEAWGGLDLLVANAGVGHFGSVETALDDHLQQLVDTNVLGTWRTVQAFLPALAGARGHVLVVGSVAGKIPLPYLAAYCATKAALVGWTRSARPELARRGVTLTLLEPGATRTPFARHSLRERGLRRGDLDEMVGRGMAAERCARWMVWAARWKPRELPLTVDGAAGVAVAKVAPHLLASLLERRMRPRRREPQAVAGPAVLPEPRLRSGPGP